MAPKMPPRMRTETRTITILWNNVYPPNQNAAYYSTKLSHPTPAKIETATRFRIPAIIHARSIWCDGDEGP